VIDRERERFFAGLSLGDLQEKHALIKQQHEIQLNRAKICGSEAHKSLIQELRLRIETVLRDYVTIDATQYPNVVVARLATMQAQEREARHMLNLWTNVKEVLKQVDSDLQVCESVLAERLKNVSQ
jgi:hypothetical protein